MLSAMKSRRGMTLAEILVTLATVAVMATMAVSFVVLITARTRANAANDALRQDRQLVESGVEGWLDAVLREGATLSTSSDGVIATINETNYILNFFNGTLSGDLPDGSKLTLRTENVTSVSFELMENSSEFLLICSVTSEDPESGEQLTPYKFCVNPRVGERGGV